MMLGGGCGRELAHWIIQGRPEKDMYGYDIRYHDAPTDSTEACSQSGLQRWSGCRAQLPCDTEHTSSRVTGVGTLTEAGTGNDYVS